MSFKLNNEMIRLSIMECHIFECAILILFTFALNVLITLTFLATECFER